MNNFCFHCEASRHGVRWGPLSMWVQVWVSVCTGAGSTASTARATKGRQETAWDKKRAKSQKCKGIALHLGADPKGAKNTRANKDNRGEEKYVLTETCKTDF